MLTLLLVAFLWPSFALGQVQVPCYGEGCVNVTVYLGPRWGSKVVMVPRIMTTPPGEEGNEYRPQPRTVPVGDQFKGNSIDDELPSRSVPSDTWSHTTRTPYNLLWPWWGPTTTRRPTQDRAVGQNPSTEVQRVSEYGAELKRDFMSMSEFDRSRLRRLYLAHNVIGQLPVMVFPVEFEYSLQELSMYNITFSPPFFNSYTRFELSRLARLKTLNMTHCGLTFVDLPILPSLEVLDLSDNKLFAIPSSLDRLANLNQLILRGNRITYIADSQIPYFNKLWLLDLSYNRLREIQGEPLENLSSLFLIKLNDNQLTSLPRLARGEKVVYLANNNLQCSCELMYWMLERPRKFERGYFESCQDGGRTIPLRGLRESPKEYGHLCDEQGWISRSVTSATIWYHRNIDIMRVIYKVVGVTVVMAALLTLLKISKKAKEMTQPRNIPYNPLEKQRVSTVSGPLVDV